MTKGVEAPKALIIAIIFVVGLAIALILFYTTTGQATGTGVFNKTTNITQWLKWG